MTDLVIGLTIIAAALAVAIRSHLDKRKREDQREKVMRRLLDYPLDCFPRERYTLSPLDIAIVRDLVDKR